MRGNEGKDVDQVDDEKETELITFLTLTPFTIMLYVRISRRTCLYVCLLEIII